MTTEKLILVLLGFILFLVFFILPLTVRITKMIYEAKMRDQLWKIFKGAVSHLGNGMLNTTTPRDPYHNKAYQDQDAESGVNLFILVLLIPTIFAVLMYWNSNRGSPEASKLEEEKTEYRPKLQLASMAINVPRSSKKKKKVDRRVKTKNVQKNQSTMDKYKIRREHYKNDDLPLPNQQKKQVKEDIITVSKEKVQTQEKAKKEVFTIQVSANSEKRFAVNTAEKLKQQFSHHWTYIYNDQYDRKFKVWIGQFNTKVEAEKFRQQLNRSTKILNIRVKNSQS